MDRAKRNGLVIIERTTDDEEKEVINATLSALDTQISQLRAWLEQTRQSVGDSLDSWQRFMSLYSAIMQWVAEKRLFLSQPLQLTCLSDAKTKCNEYGVS